MKLRWGGGEEIFGLPSSDGNILTPSKHVKDVSNYHNSQTKGRKEQKAGKPYALQTLPNDSTLNEPEDVSETQREVGSFGSRGPATVQ